MQELFYSSQVAKLLLLFQYNKKLMIKIKISNSVKEELKKNLFKTNSAKNKKTRKHKTQEKRE